MKKFVLLIVGLFLALPGGLRAESNDTVDRTDRGIRESSEDRRETNRRESERAREAQREFREDVQQRRTELRDTIAERHSDLKERLRVIRSEKKQQAVLRINSNLVTANKRATDRLIARLDRLDALRQRLSDRVIEIDSAIDTSTIGAALDSVENAVDRSRAALQAQVLKTYDIVVEDEETLGENVRVARQQLHSDLKAARETVADVHVALQSAAKSLREALRPVDDDDVNDE